MQNNIEFAEAAYRNGYVLQKDSDKVIQYYKEQCIAAYDEVNELRTRVGLYENILRKVKMQNESLMKILDLFIQG